MKEKKNVIQVFLIFYVLAYCISIALCIGVFIIYRPYVYVDNITSSITCDTNGSSFETRPNFIYTFTDSLDTFNDKKARKLCEYGLIKDYSDSLKNLSSVNYVFKPIYIQESSWIDAVIAFFISFLICIACIEIVRKIFFKKFEGVIERTILLFFLRLIY